MIPVTRVRIFEDRAQVTRKGRVALEAGNNRLRVEGVAEALVDKSLQLRVEGAVLVDARVLRRRHLRRPELAPLEEAVSSSAAVVTAVEQRLKTVGSQLEAVDLAEALCLDELAEDVSWGRVEPERWSDELDALATAGAALLGERIELEQALIRAREELADRRAQLTSASHPVPLQETWLELRLLAEEATEAEVELGYLVPGACWRPWHRAVLRDGRVDLSCEACVWQATGERWEDVELLFSTERASLGSSPPVLASDRLRAEKVGSTVQVSTREQTIERVGTGATRKAPEVPGIDDGGSATLLRAPGRATVPSDGRPTRVPLFGFSAPTQLERVLMAELAPAVLLRTRQRNGDEQPLLPGPVDLIRDSGRVGRARIDYVAPGEDFELGWGPDPELRVEREHSAVDQERRMLSSWSARRHTLTLRLSNIGVHPRLVEVVERIPVSEVEKVRVQHEAKATTDDQQPDADGFLRWSLRLDPLSTAGLATAWIVERHSDVVG